MRKIMVAWSSCLALSFSMGTARAEETKSAVEAKSEQALPDVSTPATNEAVGKTGVTKTPAVSESQETNSAEKELLPPVKLEAEKATEAKPAPEKAATELRTIGAVSWHTDYSAAYREAIKEHKQLLLLFRDDKDILATSQFEKNVLAQPELKEPLSKFARVIVSTTALAPKAKDAKPEDKVPLLMSYPCFAYMQNQAGMAIVDLVAPNDFLFGKCVSAHPFSSNTLGSAGLVRVMLELPRGTITQRTLTYVLRTHPEQPASVWGTGDPYLFDQARYGAQLMVNYGSVGHHDWGNRSAQISAYYGSGPSEVASMGGGYSLFDAAHSCVNLWRSSGVHWGMMITPGRYFGYDMVQSPNGTWFANGIMVR